MKVVSLFSGIGGIEHGLAKAGHQTILFNEIDPAATAVLAKHFPNVAIQPDIKTLDHLPRETELVTAGFPCQDLSQAGRMNGINGSKSGLVDHLFRLLGRRPINHVLIENVPFMLHLHGGRAMQYIVSHLEDLGYNWAYRTVDSRAFGLPQRRKRVFLLASRKAEPWRVMFSDKRESVEPTYSRDRACGFYWTEGNTGLGWANDAVPTLKGGSGFGIASPPAIWMPDGTIGVPDIIDGERLQGFPSSWTVPAEDAASHRFRWRLVGNAVSTPVAEWLGTLITRMDDSKPTHIETATTWRGNGWPQAAYGSPGKQKTPVTSTEWPICRKRVHLLSFLRHPLIPLSYRASEGFRTRLAKSRLHYEKDFMSDLERHCERMKHSSSVGEK